MRQSIDDMRQRTQGIKQEKTAPSCWAGVKRDPRVETLSWMSTIHRRQRCRGSMRGKAVGEGAASLLRGQQRGALTALGCALQDGSLLRAFTSIYLSLFYFWCWD